MVFSKCFHYKGFFVFFVSSFYGLITSTQLVLGINMSSKNNTGGNSVLSPIRNKSTLEESLNLEADSSGIDRTERSIRQNVVFSNHKVK